MCVSRWFGDGSHHAHPSLQPSGDQTALCGLQAWRQARTAPGAAGGVLSLTGAGLTRTVGAVGRCGPSLGSVPRRVSRAGVGSLRCAQRVRPNRLLPASGKKLPWAPPSQLFSRSAVAAVQATLGGGLLHDWRGGPCRGGAPLQGPCHATGSWAGALALQEEPRLGVTVAGH